MTVNYRNFDDEPRAMKLKLFFANTIEQPVRLARREPGPEALLVNFKRTGVEARYLGYHQVVGKPAAPVPPGAFRAELDRVAA